MIKYVQDLLIRSDFKLLKKKLENVMAKIT